MSTFTDEQHKEQARRIAKGEPLSNREVLGNMDAAKMHILERGSERGSEELAQDVSDLVDQGKVFIQEKNPNQELQKIQEAGKKLVENASAAGNIGSAQRQYFDVMSERYNDLADLATRIAFSRGMRRTTRRALLILLESLSSAVGQVEEKLESGLYNTGETSLSGKEDVGYESPQADLNQGGIEVEQVRSGFGSGSESDALQREYKDQSGEPALPRADAFSFDSRQQDIIEESAEEEFQGSRSSFGSASGSNALQSEHKDQSGAMQQSGSKPYHKSHPPEVIEGQGEATEQSGFKEFGHDSHQEGSFEGDAQHEHHRSRTESRADPQTLSQAGFDQQRDTQHTRKNFKVFIRGQEFDFMNQDLTAERKEWIAEETQNICIDISSDQFLKESASAFVRVIKSASQMEIEKPALNLEAGKALEDMRQNLTALLDHMADDYDFCRMEKAWNCFIEKTKRDDELERDWRDLFSYLKESFLSKRLAMSNDWKDTFIQKQDCLRAHLMSLKPELFNLLQEFDCFLTALKDDKFISETSNSVEKLSKDLFLDRDGNFEFKAEALKQIRDIIVPEIIEQFKFIAIPDFQDEDETQFSEISNAVFKSEGLLPEDVLIQNTTDIKLSRRNDNVLKTSIHVLIEGMNFDIQDMHLKYQRKVFPQLKDEGDFNICSTGKRGVKLEMWLSANAENAELFKVDDVDVSISGLRIYDSRVKEYTFLFTIFKPLLQTMMRTQMEKAIENKIKNTLFDLRGLKGF